MKQIYSLFHYINFIEPISYLIHVFGTLLKMYSQFGGCKNVVVIVVCNCASVAYKIYLN